MAREHEPPNAFHYGITFSVNDIDDLKHVNNVVYLRWVQEAASAHWNVVASEELKKKYSWVVLRHEIDYRQAAYLGDQLVAHTWVGTCEGARSVRHVHIYQSDSNKIIAEAKTTWCLLDASTMKPKRIENDIISIFMQH